MTEHVIHLPALKSPFPPDRISWRVGSTNKDKTKGLALAYIDARDVMQRLDDVCGCGHWQNDYPHAGQKTVCRIGILLDGQWVWKSNGAGDTDIEADKGALSDAFKRAAVLWGIGQYLYDLDSPWVTLEAKGRSHVIARHEYARLHKLVGGSTSNQLNNSDAWGVFMTDLSQCQSVPNIERLYRTLREEGWSEKYLAQAAQECANQKASVEAAITATNGHDEYANHPLNAG